jgi:hypothetical protein
MDLIQSVKEIIPRTGIFLNDSYQSVIFKAIITIAKFSDSEFYLFDSLQMLLRALMNELMFSTSLIVMKALILDGRKQLI